MKRLLYLTLITLLLSCNAKKQSQNVISKSSLEFIEATKQRIYLGQMTKSINFTEQWVVNFKGPDLKDQKAYLYIDNYKIAIEYKSEPGVVFGSDYKDQKIEFKIEYPLSNNGELIEDKKEEKAYLLFIGEKSEETLTLKEVRMLEPLIYPTTQD